MADLLARIINSKKVALAMVPIVVNLVVMFTGIADPTQPLMLLVDGLFALLVAAQALLDHKWGSVSDGTGPE